MWEANDGERKRWLISVSGIETAAQPVLYSPHHGLPDDAYIVIMMDNTINLNGTETTALHWYESDLRVTWNSLSGRILNASDPSAPSASYVGPQPLPGPPHHFVILLYRQPEDYELPSCLDVVLPTTLGSRIALNLEEFVKVADLGTPFAANWFQVQDSTPPTTTYAITSTFIASYTCEPTSTAI